MTNPIVDALEWDPDYPAASISALLTALMALQAEWDTKIPQLGQISRNGAVTEDDWLALIAQKDFDEDRADNTYLHFDNVNQEFEGEWANIFGEIQQGMGVVSDKTVAHVLTNRVSIVATTADVFNNVIVLPRSAKFDIYLPFMVNRTAGANNVTITLKIATVSVYSYDLVPTSGSWEPYYVVFHSAEYAAGSVTIEVEATVGATTTCEFADIAPLPNVTGTTPLGIVTPYLGYIEAIYQ